MGFLQYRVPNLLTLNVNVANSQCQCPPCRSHRSVLRDRTKLQRHP